MNYQEVEMYAKKFNGSVKKFKVIKLDDTNNFNFRCINKHNFKLNKIEIFEEKWCYKCDNNLIKMKNHIINKRGKIESICNFNSEISIHCKSKHISKYNFNNLLKIKREWCKPCKNIKKGYISKNKISKQNIIMDTLKNKIDIKNPFQKLISLNWIILTENKEFIFYKKYINNFIKPQNFIKTANNLKEYHNTNNDLINLFKICIIIYFPYSKTQKDIENFKLILKLIKLVLNKN